MRNTILKPASCGTAMMVSVFVVNALAAAVTPFLVLPSALRISGSTGWSSLAVGAAVGSLCAIVTGLGWPVTGPVKVSAAPAESRRRLYNESVRSRLMVFFPSVLSSVLICSLISARPFVSSVSCIGTALIGLSASWYYIGCGEAVRLLTYTTSARLLASLAGIGFALRLREISIYCIAIALGETASVIWCSWDIVRRTSGRSRPHPSRPIRDVLREQLPATITAASAGIYVTLPLPIVALVAPPAAAGFAAAQSLLQFANALSRPLTQSLQAWTPREQQGRLRLRILKCVHIGFGFCLPFSFLTCLSAYLLLPVISSSQFKASAWESVFVGLAAGSIVLSQVFGLVGLAALGMISTVMRSTVAGAVVGLIALPVGAALAGSTGAWCALATAELTVAVYQYIILRGALRTAPIR